MKESQQKTVEKVENYSDHSIKRGERLEFFRLELRISDGNNLTRTAEFVQGKESEMKLKLLGLISSLLQCDLITNSDLQSQILKGRAGRKELCIDETTGKVKGRMKSLNKQVVELWNEGKEVEEIATILRPLKKNKRRSDFIARIRRILWTNQRLLLRAYSQEI